MESDSTPVADSGSLTDSTEPSIALSGDTAEETSPSGAVGEEEFAVSQDSVATTAAPALEEPAPLTADPAISESQPDVGADEDAIPLPVNRFSRKFGEIPLVG